jgi:hypothetical protein
MWGANLLSELGDGERYDFCKNPKKVQALDGICITSIHIMTNTTIAISGKYDFLIDLKINRE